MLMSSGSNKDSSDDDTEQADTLCLLHNELVSKKGSENSEDNNERMPTDLKHLVFLSYVVYRTLVIYHTCSYMSYRTMCGR